MRVFRIPIIILAFSMLEATAQNREPATEQTAPAAPFETRTIDTVGIPWCVAVEGDTIYFTVTGAEFEEKTVKEDGYIGVIKPGEDKPTVLTATGYLKSPKGIMVMDEWLVITDVDHVYMINKETGKMDGYVPLNTDGPFTGLNGIAKMDDRLIVTCTDKNRLYYIDPVSFTYAQLVTKEPIFAPSGVVWDAEKKLIYIAECAVETDSRGRETPSGRILSVHPVTGEIAELEMRMGRKLRGQFAGLALKDGELYFSDWSIDKKPETIRKYNFKSMAITNAATAPMQKVTEFAVRGNQLIIPASLDKKIFIANLPAEKRR